ncbi:MAG: CheW domain protein [Thermoanaerobacterales bacterium 50_218]|nr:MAG: CheW domain protein [Thermoanaerobacterales bacterium 50_218]HAA90264.1 chemotaxis protein CheW [Peptococcaceae bacterium]
MEEVKTRIEEEVQLVVFSVGEEEYALEIEQVQEINRLLPITRVPRAPSFIEGVINLRGNVIPVVNLHYRLGVGTRVNTNDTRIIIALVYDNPVGLVVDRVSEVLYLPKNRIESPDSVGGIARVEYLRGIGKVDGRLILLLNLDALLEVDRLLKQVS